MKTIKELKKLLKTKKDRSAWKRGVSAYISELLDGMEEEHGENHEMCGSPADKKDLLNGADDWDQSSYGGCFLIYDFDIAERLCSPSELKKCKGGERNPNSVENWIDVQARALYQAANWIHKNSSRNATIAETVDIELIVNS